MTSLTVTSRASWSRGGGDGGLDAPGASRCRWCRGGRCGLGGGLQAARRRGVRPARPGAAGGVPDALTPGGERRGWHLEGVQRRRRSGCEALPAPVGVLLGHRATASASSAKTAASTSEVSWA